MRFLDLPFMYILSTWKLERAFARSFAELTTVAFSDWPSLPGKASSARKQVNKAARKTPDVLRRQPILLCHGFTILICKATT